MKEGPGSIQCPNLKSVYLGMFSKNVMEGNALQVDNYNTS